MMTARLPIARRLASALQRLGTFLADEQGATAAIWALMVPALVGFMGFAIDFGRVYQVQLQLQAASNAAALAGGYNLPSGTAVATATSYSALTGKQNAFPTTAGVTVSMVSGFPLLKCLATKTSTLGPCQGTELAGGANVIQVKQQAVLSTYFLRYAGISSMTLQATATAAAKGGSGQSLDVVVIVDATASMGSTLDATCGLTAPAYRLNCALSGVQALLMGLNPALDQVGIMVFPGLVNQTAVNQEFNCTVVGGVGVGTQAYDNSPIYQITPLSNNFKTSMSSLTLNQASNNVLATNNNAGCANTTKTNMDATGGVGTFYANVITAAQTYLVANGRAHTQRVIIILSDGSASASSTYMAAAKVNNQCHEAITAADAAATAGTWIYSIAYGASTATSSCPTDTGANAISACATMLAVASDPTKFYSDTAGGSLCPGGNSILNLVNLFSAISADLSEPRLIPDNTT